MLFFEKGNIEQRRERFWYTIEDGYAGLDIEEHPYWNRYQDQIYFDNSKIGSQLILHQVAVTLPVVPRIHYCPQQTQVAIAPNCGVFDLVVDHSYVNST